MEKISLEERPRIPFDAHSEYAQTYHAHELPQRLAYQAPPTRAQVPFDGTTTNKDTYVQHAIEPRYRSTFAPALLSYPQMRTYLTTGHASNSYVLVW